MHLQLEEFARKSVEIKPGTIEMLSPIELTQYYIQVNFLTILYPKSEGSRERAQERGLKREGSKESSSKEQKHKRDRKVMRESLED